MGEAQVHFIDAVYVVSLCGRPAVIVRLPPWAFPFQRVGGVMFGEGVLATDAFATFLSSQSVANCGGGELPVGGEVRKWRIAAVANAQWRIRKLSNRGPAILF